MNWSTIKRIERHKVVALAPYWLLFLSVYSVYSTASVSRDVDFSIFQFHLPVPHFIISSMLITVAKLLYYVFCPGICAYSTYKDFRVSGRDKTRYLNDMLRDIKNPKKQLSLYQECLPSDPGLDAAVDKYIAVSKLLKDGVLPGDAHVFWVMHDHFTSKISFVLILTLALYGFAFLFSAAGYYFEFKHNFAPFLDGASKFFDLLVREYFNT